MYKKSLVLFEEVGAVRQVALVQRLLDELKERR